MELRRLYMRNFLAVGDEPVEIKFEQQGGITLIRGNNQDVSGKSSNGSGKSTIIEGIFFGLTGSTLRKLTGPAIIHNAAASECLVEIEYDDTKIIRTLKRQGKTVKSGLEFYVGGQAKHLPSVPETNKKVDEHRGVNFETLSNILIFGQHNILSFLDASEGDKREVVENLMNLREYNQYEQNARDLHREAKGKMKSLEEKLNVQEGYIAQQTALFVKQEGELNDYRRKLRAEVAAITARIDGMPDLDQLKAMWKAYDEYVETKQKYADRANASAAERNARESAYNYAVAAKQGDANNKQPLIDKVNAVKGKFAVLEDRKRSLWQELVVPLTQAIDKEQNLINSTRTATNQLVAALKLTQNCDHEIIGIEKQIKQHQDRIDHLKSHGVKDGETCPTCFGKVDGKNAQGIVSAVEEEIQLLKGKLQAVHLQKVADEDRLEAKRKSYFDALRKAEDAAESEVAELMLRRHGAEENVKAEYFSAKEKLTVMLADAEKAVEQFDAELNARHDPIIAEKQTAVHAANAEYAAAKADVDALRHVDKPSVAVEELGKLQTQLDADKELRAEKEHLIDNNPYVGMIETLKQSLNKLDADAGAVKVEIAEVQAKLPYYDFWVGHMGSQGLKSYVVENILPTLNEQIDYWMQIIYQGSISVKFDKFFNVSMLNNASGNEMIFGQGSGGERRRIDIAIMLAFRQVMQLSNGKRPNLLFLDEVAESLDEPGVYGLHDAIQQLAKDTQVYVVTHNQVLMQLLENADIIQVMKKNGSMKVKHG